MPTNRRKSCALTPRNAHNGPRAVRVGALTNKAAHYRFHLVRTALCAIRALTSIRSATAGDICRKPRGVVEPSRDRVRNFAAAAHNVAAATCCRAQLMRTSAQENGRRAHAARSKPRIAASSLGGERWRDPAGRQWHTLGASRYNGRMSAKRADDSMSLFAEAEAGYRQKAQPLAARMRPRTLAEFAGQKHFLAEGKLLRRLIAADRLGSVIFYGPPGTGKTTLAQLLAGETKCKFQQVNAVATGVKELREVLDAARDRLSAGGPRTLLFVDEIHRFNKAQQDVLLPDVEDGGIVLVGATTQNPFFALTSALVSRSRVFEFKPLSRDDIKELLRRAVADEARGLGRYDVRLHDDAVDFLGDVSDGDARRALSALEVGVLSAAERPVEFTKALAEESIQKKAIEYDRSGDGHYDAASALIKSIRGSDPDAAIYWLARMLEAGEEVRFLARRAAFHKAELARGCES